MLFLTLFLMLFQPGCLPGLGGAGCFVAGGVVSVWLW